MGTTTLLPSQCVNLTTGTRVPLVDPPAKHRLSSAAIAGIATASVIAGFVLFIALAWCSDLGCWGRLNPKTWRRKRREAKEKEMDSKEVLYVIIGFAEKRPLTQESSAKIFKDDASRSLLIHSCTLN